MSIDLKASLLDASREAKQARIDLATEFKRQLFAVPVAPPAPVSIDGFQSLAEYEAAGNIATADTVGQFRNREFAQTQAGGTQALDAAAAREAGAFVKNRDLDSTVGQVGQLAAGVVQGTNRMVGQLAAAPVTALGSDSLSLVDDHARELFTKPKRNALEEAYLDQVPERVGRDGVNLNTQSYRQLLESSQQDLAKAAAITDSFENTDNARRLNTTNREELSADLGASYAEHGHHFTAANKARKAGDWGTVIAESGAGIAKLLAAGGADLAANPAAVFEYVAENAPQLAVGGVSTKALGATNIAYGADIYQKSLADYTANNDGALPSQAEQGEMALWAMSASMAEQVGDVSVLAAFKGGKVSAAVAAVTDRLMPAIVGKVTNNIVTRTAAGLGKTALAEGSTEGFQTAVEDTFSKLKGIDDLDGKAIFEGAAIGAASGAALSSPGVVGQELATSYEKGKAQLAARVKAAGEATMQAKVTGDTSALDNPESPSYDMVKASLAMSARARDAETPEIKAEAVAKLDELLVKQDSRIVDLELDIEDSTDVTKRLELKKKLAFEEKQLTEMRKRRDDTVAFERPAPDQLDSLLTTAQAPEASPERDTAVSQVMALLMEDNGAIDPEQAARLARSENFTPEQRKVLVAFSEAHAVVNAALDSTLVQGNVIQGRDGFKGLVEFQSDAATNIRTRNRAAANKDIGKLVAFEESQRAKLAALTEAIALRGSTGEPAHYYRTVDGGFAVTGGPAPWKNDTQRSQMGGFTVNNLGKAQGHADKIKAEADMISLVSKSISSQYRLAFKGAEAGAAAVSPPGETGSATTEEVAIEPATEIPAAENAAEITADSAEAEPDIEEEITRDETDDEALARLSRSYNPEARETQAEPGVEAIPVSDKVPTISDAGVLRLVRDKTLRVVGNLGGEAFRTTNLVSAYFQQKVAGVKAKSGNPLVAIENFVAAYAADSGILAEEFTEEQQYYLSTFVSFAKTMASKIEANILGAPNEPTYRYRNYVQFFRDDLDANLVSAIALGAFTYLAEAGNEDGRNSVLEIARTLGIEEYEVTPEHIALLETAGVRQSLVIQELGKAITAALNLRAHKDAPDGEQQKLELSLGGQALALMLQLGYAERTDISSPLLAGNRTEEKRDTNANDSFITLRRDANGETMAAVRKIADASKNTEGLMEKLFSIEPHLRAPGREPTFAQDTTARTARAVPAGQGKVLKEVNKRPNGVRADMQKARASLSEANQLALGGYVDEAYVHEMLFKAVDSKNASIARDLDHQNEFETEIEQDDFFFTPRVINNQRVMILENLVDPQSSKIQRHLNYMRAWDTTVDPASANDVLMVFKLAVALGMGIKTDKLIEDKSLDALDKLMATDDVAEAVTALRRLNTLPVGTELSAQEQAAIVAVSESRAKYHTLDALVNWAAYLDAQEKGETFQSQIMYEVDGVTNGPALSQIFLGHAAGLGGMFGFYGPDGPADFAEWKSDPGNKDLYERTAGRLTTHLPQSPASPKIRRAVLALLGKGGLDGQGRNLVKQPLTSMVFGAGVDKTIKNMGISFVWGSPNTKGIYEQMQILANANDLTGLEMLVANVNDLLPPGMQWPKPTSFEHAMSLKLSPAQEDRVQGAFVNSIGFAVREAINEDFQPFIDTRTVLNNAANAIFLRYNTARDFLINEKTQQLMADDLMPFRVSKGVKYPLQGLAPAALAEIEAQLKEVLPIIHTVLSKRDGDLNAGLDMLKISREMANDNTQAYAQTVKVGGPAIKVTAGEGVAGKGGPQYDTTQQLQARGLLNTLIEPGVRTIIMAIHAADSAIALDTYAKFEALHIHDAEGFKLDEARAGAALLNESTVNVLLEYSVGEELVAAFERSMAGMSGLVKEYPELGAQLAALTVGKGKEPQVIDDQLLAQVKQTVAEMEHGKFEFLSRVSTVNQYAMQGGSHTVTAEQREIIAAGLKKYARPEPTPAPAPAQTPAGISQWGKLGQPVPEFQVEPAIEAYLSSGEPNLGGLMNTTIQVLSARIAEAGSNFTVSSRLSFMKLLAEKLKTAGQAATPARLVTPDSVPDNMEGQHLETLSRPGVLAWYSQPSDEMPLGRINMKSGQFTGPGTGMEPVIHEATHAVASQIINRMRWTPPGQVKPEDRDAWEAVDELIRLQGLAQRYVKANSKTLGTRFDNAVADVHELVSWGLTNRDFQLQVLAKLPMDGFKSTAISRINTGMRQFIASLAKMFFGKSAREGMTTGMGVMIANAGILLHSIEQQGQQPEAQPTQPPLLMATVGPESYDSQQIFAGLGQNGHAPVTDGFFYEHLSGLLSGVVDVVYQGSNALRDAALRTAPASAEDVYLQALASGQTPFVYSLTNRLGLGDQAAFVAQSVQLAVSTMMNNSGLVQRELKTIYDQVKGQVSAKDFYQGDWSLASQYEKDAAQEIYDFVFTPTRNTTGGSDFLSQFMAAALTYEPLYNKLKTLNVAKDSRTIRSGTFADRLTALFGMALDTLSRVFTRTTPEQNVAGAVTQLANSLARIEASKQSQLMGYLDTAENLVEKVGRNVNDAARKGVAAVAKAPILRKSGVKAVRAASGVVAVVAGGHTAEMLDFFKDLTDGMSTGRLGFFGELLNEVRGEQDYNKQFVALLAEANKHEQERKQRMERITRIVKTAFGRELTNEEMEALTPVVMRTDLPVLLSHGFDLAQVQTLLSDPAALDAAIAAWETKLNKVPHELALLRQSKDLAYFMTTGRNVNPNLLLNAHNIAHMANTQYQMNEGQDEIASTLDPLITLYALKYLSPGKKKLVSDLMVSEAARTDGNGIDLVFQMQRKWQEISLRDNFRGSQTHMIKGYVKEILNPNVTMQVANDLEGHNLILAGYERHGKDHLPQDPADPTGPPRALYVLRDKGLTGTVTGTMSSTNLQSKGHEVAIDSSGLTAKQFHAQTNRMKNQIAQAKDAAYQAVYTTPRSYDPTTDTKGMANHMAPVLNEYGGAAEYRYMMEDKTKAKLLQPNTRLDDVMGAMAGSAFDRMATPALNQHSVDAHLNVWVTEGITNPDAFIEFGPLSADPVIRERYKLLPDATKQYIKNTWNGKSMMIRNDLYKITFGFRKYSLTDMFGKDTDERNFAEKAFVYIFEHLPYRDSKTGRVGVLGAKAALKLAQAENIWMEMTKMVKDTLVIKSGMTLWGNELSNLTVLRMAGVSFKDIARDKAIAYQGALAYKRESREKFELDTKLELGVLVGAEKKAAEERVVELEDSLSRNPVNHLIDAGMYQTLVEDIEVEEDPYSYKSRLVRTVNKYTGEKSTDSRVQTARTVAKTILMTHDSTLYKFMNHATVLSDFTSRYVLHKHLTTRANPLSEEEAMAKARDYFVNYDVPTHKGIQYLNDAGLVWFTKYYLRIQKVILDLVKENPAGAIALLGLNDVFGAFSDILDSSAVSKWPINLGGGALELPASFNDLATTRWLF